MKKMGFVPMHVLLEKARREGYAVPSFCVWGAESAAAVRRAASRLKAPVIFMCGPLELTFFTPGEIAGIVRAEPCDVPAALHLDHGDSPERVHACLEAGFTSVMLDYSLRPFAENAAALRAVVDKARPLGVTVEGELGHVGKAAAGAFEGGGASTLTEPGEAVDYVKATGVDALAVSIGNAHGQYTQLPRFDFRRLEALSAALPDLPLVLHGGSGTPEADIRQAIGLGIAKVNVATELLMACRSSLLSQWNNGRNNWPPLAFAEAGAAMTAVVEKWIRITGAEGKA